MAKFQQKASQYVCYKIWESRCTKIIVSRLLKLIVLYIRIDESVWHPNTEPNFFRTRFVKRLRPAEKFIFQIMQLLWALKKFFWHRPQPWWRAFNSTLADSRYMYHYFQKYSGCKTGLNSSQAITISVRPCPVLLRSSGMS